MLSNALDHISLDAALLDQGIFLKIRYISNFTSIYGIACQNTCHPIWIGLTGAPKLGVQKHLRTGLVFRLKSV
jgi:hypothetical protein